MVLRPRSLRAPFREVMLKKKTPGMTQGRPSGFQCIDAYVYNCIYSIIYLSYIQVRIHTYIHIYIYMHVSYYLLMSVQKNHEPYPLEPHQQIPMAFPWKPISKSGTWKSDSSSSCSLKSPLYGLFYPFLGIPWYTQFPDTQKYRAYHCKKWIKIRHGVWHASKSCIRIQLGPDRA